MSHVTPSLALGGLAPLSHVTPSLALGGLISQPDPPLLGGLPLSRADFRTYHAPLPPPHMIGSIDRLHGVSPGNPPRSKTIQTLENTRLPTTRRTRRHTAIVAGTTPSRPDLAARSGFAASAASAPPPLRASPPSRSARLGSTTSDRPASNNAPPTPPATTPDSPPLAAPVPTQRERILPPPTLPSTRRYRRSCRHWRLSVTSKLRPPRINAVRRYLAVCQPPAYMALLAAPQPRLRPTPWPSCPRCLPAFGLHGPTSYTAASASPDHTALVRSLLISLRPIRPY